MGVLRSEDMKAGTLALPSEKAAAYVNAVGRNVNIQFTDMKANQSTPIRPYKKYVQRIEEMERIIRVVMDDVTKYGFEYYKNAVEGFLETEADEYKLDAVEAELKSVYAQFISFKANNATLITDRNGAIEELRVVEVAQKNFGNVKRPGAGLNEGLMDGTAISKADGVSMTFSNIAGVIAEEDQQRFARFVFRLSRGNTYTNFTPITTSTKDTTIIDDKTGEPVKGLLVDPKTGKSVKKSVFVIFFQDSKEAGMAEGALYSKIMKAAATFGVNIYDWPSSKQD